VKSDLGAAAELLAGGILANSKRAAGSRLPDVLVVIVVLGGHGDTVGNEVSRVETNTELADAGDISTGGHGLHERLGAGLGDGAEHVHKVSLGHAHTRVDDADGLVGFVGLDVDEELLLCLEDGLVSQTLVTDLVKGIRGVGNQLAQEDFLVAVEGVDDEGEQLVAPQS